MNKNKFCKLRPRQCTVFFTVTISTSQQPTWKNTNNETNIMLELYLKLNNCTIHDNHNYCCWEVVLAELKRIIKYETLIEKKKTTNYRRRWLWKLRVVRHIIQLNIQLQTQNFIAELNNDNERTRNRNCHTSTWNLRWNIQQTWRTAFFEWFISIDFSDSDSLSKTILRWIKCTDG